MSANSGSHPLRVLVVDDEPRIRKALTVCLEGEGYEVESVARAARPLRLRSLRTAVFGEIP